MNKIEKFILNNVANHPNDITKVTVKEFGISRQGVSRYLRKLIKNEKLIKTGKTINTLYYLTSGDKFSFIYKINSSLEESVVWKQDIAPLIKDLPQNIYDISAYGFTEMFNNAIDHSIGKEIYCKVSILNGYLEIAILDDGIGIFKKIMDAFKLSSLRESILHLTKGKLTTDPKKHTGEGIFFTSRAFDEFLILSDALSFMRFQEDDWLIERIKNKEKGTSIFLKIKLNSNKNIADVFKKYTDSETHNFDKTTAYVQLSKNEDEDYISRSQAKRLLIGLKKFKRVVFDFKDVKSVGQGFVDQVFRIFKEEYPDIDISYVNANEDVEFMIKRGLG